MVYVPGFDHDVFISYAHIVNRTSNWIGSLEEGLRNKLSELAGEEIDVWRDPKLDGNDAFNELISKSVASSAVFVAVVSPRYVASESCLSECRTFVGSPRLVTVGEKSRIARVRKTRLPPGSAEPTELAPDQSLGFQFFEEKDGRVIEYENEKTLNGYQQFWDGVKRLAGAIDKVLRLLKSDSRPKRKQVVFLSDTVKALAASREELKREIVGRGHVVVPDGSLVSDGTFAQVTAEEAVASACFAIHLLGASYGMIPEGQVKSVPHLEYALARERRLPQLVWLAPDTAGPVPAAADQKLASLVDEVTQADGDGRTLEVCKTDFGSFKEVMLDALTKDYAPVSTITECKSVYLLFHDVDMDSEDLKSIRKHLLDAGYPVNIPAFEATDDRELRQIEEQSVLNNDATLIYYGRAKDSWIELKRRFLISALGRAQRGGQSRRAVYLCPPTTRTKEFTFGDFKGGKPLLEARGFLPLLVVGDFEPFSHEKLRPLLDWLAE